MPPPDVDLVPVDHDPFNSPDQAAMSPESYANPLVQKFLGGVVGGLATLPQRAIQNSQWSVDTGNYDPGPTLEAATLPMGAGAIAGVPVKAGEAVVGAGPIRAYHGSAPNPEMMRLYRGERDWGPYPNEMYRPRAQFWTTDLDTAKQYGEPRYIDVSHDELAKEFSRDVHGHYQAVNGGFEYHGKAQPLEPPIMVQPVDHDPFSGS